MKKICFFIIIYWGQKVCQDSIKQNKIIQYRPQTKQQIVLKSLSFQRICRVLNLQIKSKQVGVCYKMYNAQKKVVKLNVYDISQGLASGMCQQLFNLHYDYLYLTSISVYENQYYFTKGICIKSISQRPFGSPTDQSYILGETEVTLQVFQQYLDDLKGKYNQNKFNLINLNSNMFSNQIAQFLLDKTIDKKYLTQFKELIQTPLGQMIPQFLLDTLKFTIFNPPPGMFNQD